MQNLGLVAVPLTSPLDPLELRLANEAVVDGSFGGLVCHEPIGIRSLSLCG